MKLFCLLVIVRDYLEHCSVSCYIRGWCGFVEPDELIVLVD